MRKKVIWKDNDIFNISKEAFFELCKYGDTDIWHELETGKILTNDFWSKFNSTIGNLQRALIDGTYKLNSDINIHNIPNYLSAII